MRRRRLYRIVALPLALWFVALAADVGGVDACPMHDAMAHGVSGAMMTMATPHAPVAARGPAAPMAPAPRAPVHCTCMGVCCGCAMATLPPWQTAQLPAAGWPQHVVRVDRAQRPLAAPAPFVLPPSIGPPALLA
jgi:hypothetical protein